MKTLRAVGIMSGTSLDGMDGVLIEARPRGTGYRVKILAHRFRPFSPAWRRKAREIAERNLLREAAMLGVRWSESAATLVKDLSRNAGIPLSAVDLIGAHGQTLVHEPRPHLFLSRKIAFTIQVADLSRLSQRTGVPVVGNFRPADIAAGGQGAPLVPAAHRLLFGHKSGSLAVQNLGGIGNVTLLGGGRVLLAFDTGPADLWIDTIARWKSGGRKLFDRDGMVARSGKPDLALLARLLSHPYFRRKPPKSAGWEEFGPAYLARYRSRIDKLSIRDALATATHATAIATADAYERFVYPRARPTTLILAGGGARNRFLVERIGSLLPGIGIHGSDDFGISPEQLEPVCFALLALETFRGRAANEPNATGARDRVICGEIARTDPSRIDTLRAARLR
jgi:anhydro-N-acetylmuramic acid kinase